MTDAAIEWALLSLIVPFILWYLIRNWDTRHDPEPEIYSIREEEEVHFQKTAFIERLDKDDY